MAQSVIVLSAVLLDVGGTLWPDRLTAPLDPAPVLARIGRLLPEMDPVEALSRLSQALNGDEVNLVQNTRALLAQALFSFGGSSAQTDPDAIRRALCQPASAGVQLFPGAAQLLGDIRRLSLRCIIVSNVKLRGEAEYWRDFVDLGVADCIDRVVTSLDVGYRKPHTLFFEAAMRAAECDASSCVMVGNSEVNDIQPAVDLGMRAIRVAIEEPLPRATAAHAVAERLERVSEILKCWANPR